MFLGSRICNDTAGVEPEILAPGLQVCYAFFLMLGTVGYRASLMFVRHIYRCAARALSCYFQVMQ